MPTKKTSSCDTEHILHCMYARRTNDVNDVKHGRIADTTVDCEEVRVHRKCVKHEKQMLVAIMPSCLVCFFAENIRWARMQT